MKQEPPDDRRYTKQHEWILSAGDTATVGITDFAQNALGDITFVELPEVGREFQAGEEMAVVESTKAASDIYAPVSGTVSEVNTVLADDPAAINTDPFNRGWLVKLKLGDTAETEHLMTAGDYSKHCAGDA